MLTDHPLLDLLFRILKGCKPSDMNGVLRVRLGHEPTPSERELLDRSNINLKFEYADEVMWVTAETDDVTLMLRMDDELKSPRHGTKQPTVPALASANMSPFMAMEPISDPIQ